MSELELELEQFDANIIDDGNQGFVAEPQLDPRVEIYLSLEAIYDSDSSEEYFEEDISNDFEMDYEFSANNYGMSISKNYNIQPGNQIQNIGSTLATDQTTTMPKTSNRPAPPSKDLYKTLINQSEHPIKPVQHSTGAYSYSDDSRPLQYDSTQFSNVRDSPRDIQLRPTMLQRSLDAMRQANSARSNLDLTTKVVHGDGETNRDTMGHSFGQPSRQNQPSTEKQQPSQLVAPTWINSSKKQSDSSHTFRQTALQKPAPPLNAHDQDVLSTSASSQHVVPPSTHKRPPPPSAAFMHQGPLPTSSQMHLKSSSQSPSKAMPTTWSASNQTMPMSHFPSNQNTPTSQYANNQMRPQYPTNPSTSSRPHAPTISPSSRPQPPTISSPSQPSEQSTEAKIIAFLQNQGRPCNTNSIRLTLGAATKKELNPLLYSMQRKGSIKKVYDVPPTWELCQGKSVTPRPSGQSFPGQSLQRGYQSPSTPSLPKTSQNQSLITQPKPGGSSTTKEFFEACFTSINKNPVSAFNNYAQKNKSEATFEIISQKTFGKPSFTVAAKLGQRMFTAVTASNMKEAKRQAADVALRELGQASGSGRTDSADGKLDLSNLPSIPQNNTWTHFDRMAALSHQLFARIAPTVSASFAGRKVIACMIMKTSNQDTGRVVSLGAGNRCITGQRISLEGKKVNDSHAEIVARRGLLRVLYKEINNCLAGRESIFMKKENAAKLSLRDGVTFHLYISTAPCGDGALFSPREGASVVGGGESLTRDHTPTFTSKQQGILRTKIEDGEGTLPIDFDAPPQTWDGLLQGERLRTMSCSDKICRWNVLGLQGSLLSHFVQPIYLDSLTLGYLYDHGHLSRAVCCRLQHKDDLNARLAQGYHVNHPCIGRVTAYDPPRETEKTNNISINWALGDSNAEVTDGRDGACLTRTGNAPTPSRLCKAALYGNFRELCRKAPEFHHLLNTESYKEAKSLAEDFCRCKKEMKAQFKASKYSQWVSKPMEQDLFSEPLPALDI